MALYGEPLPPYPASYCKGVWLFDRRYFFECHEVLEELWKETVGTPKLFYQMLIHAAVCFVHWENGNRKGVLSLHHTFELKDAQVPADLYMGLHITRLKADMAALVNPLRTDPNLALAPYAEIVTPTLRISGFESLVVEEEELRVLGMEDEGK